jgi:excisionase family DNA binding protein
MMSDLLTAPEAAQYLRVDPTIFSRWVIEGRYPIPITKVGPYPRFRKAHLDRWLKSRTVLLHAAGA